MAALSGALAGSSSIVIASESSSRSVESGVVLKRRQVAVAAARSYSSSTMRNNTSSGILRRRKSKAVGVRCQAQMDPPHRDGPPPHARPRAEVVDANSSSGYHGKAGMLAGKTQTPFNNFLPEDLDVLTPLSSRRPTTASGGPTRDALRASIMETSCRATWRPPRCRGASARRRCSPRAR